jgi:hypothetical protein
MLGSTSRSKRLSRRREMGFRFWRRVRIIPGMRVNLSKSGASLSVGRRGAWFTVGPRGRTVTLGLPGTSLCWTEHLPPDAPSASHPHAGRGCGTAAILVAVVAIAALILIAGFAGR